MAQQPSWWGKNWKWFVPVGCLSMVLLVAAFIALIFTFVFGMMKNSTAYSEALERARANPAVSASLGTPIEEGFFVSGNVSESGPSGEAELSIPISGPRGAGTIYLEARKSAGAWTFSRLVVEVDATNERIDLLEPAASLEPPPSPTF